MSSGTSRRPPEPIAAEPYLHKQFREARFVTNGFDYRFSRAEFSPVEGAGLALLDLLNAAIDGAPLRGSCRSQVLVRSASDRGWIAGFLREQAPAPGPVFARLNKPTLCLEPEGPTGDMHFPWMVSDRREAVPVPRLRTEDDVAPDCSQWLYGASLDLAELKAQTAVELLDRAGRR